MKQYFKPKRPMVERCKHCGQPASYNRHVCYGNDLDNPVKHPFEPARRNVRADNKFFNHSDGRAIALLNAAEDVVNDLDISPTGEIDICLKKLLSLQIAVKRAKTLDMNKTSHSSTVS